ncbi:hypothetical protein CARUB_v10003543mg, partial [Capsella rubella]
MREVKAHPKVLKLVRTDCHHHYKGVEVTVVYDSSLWLFVQIHPYGLWQLQELIVSGKNCYLKIHSYLRQFGVSQTLLLQKPEETKAILLERPLLIAHLGGLYWLIKFDLKYHGSSRIR